MARTMQGDLRAKILEAARDRMLHYGFKKTTIDEVAADAGVGKGTVYLYFDSKEDIALAILACFKEQTVTRMREIAGDPGKSLTEKLTEMLSFPIIESLRSCERNPGSVDTLMSIRPHIQVRLRPYIEQETAIIAEMLDEANRAGVLDVADTMKTARALKYMVAGFWPPIPCCPDVDAVESEIAHIVELSIRGLRNCGAREHLSRSLPDHQFNHSAEAEYR